LNPGNLAVFGRIIVKDGDASTPLKWCSRSFF
jgi:hypothetical protein